MGMLLRAGIEVDHINNVGWTALLEAIILGDGGQRYTDTVRVLIAGGADPLIASQQDGISPIDHAQTRGFWTIATSLFAAIHSDLPEDPIAALFSAARSNDADGAMLALRAGADPNVQDANGNTALIDRRATGVSGREPIAARIRWADLTGRTARFQRFLKHQGVRPRAALLRFDGANEASRAALPLATVSGPQAARFGNRYAPIPCDRSR